MAVCAHTVCTCEAADGSAPIFDFSDFGVVGDLHAIVPQLTALVKERKA